MATFRHTLSPSRRAEMLARFRAGETQGALAVIYGVSLRTVGRVCAGTALVAAREDRPCLGCSRSFPSRSRWNRMCAACNEVARTVAFS